MGAYCLVANKVSIGGTIDTFDAVNTRNANVTMRQGTTALNAIVNGSTRSATTAGDATMLRIRVTSADMGISNEDFLSSYFTGGGPATNSQSVQSEVEYFPVDWKASGGAILNFSVSPTGKAVTDTWSVQLGAQHIAGTPPPAAWFTQAMGYDVLPSQGSRSSGGAAVSATTRTTLVSTTIPGRYTKLIGFTPGVAIDAINTTAGVELTGFDELTGTIQDMVPNEYPIPPCSGVLGTPVGEVSYVQQRPIPIYLEKGTGQETFEPFLTLLLAQDTTQAFAYDVRLRY